MAIGVLPTMDEQAKRILPDEQDGQIPTPPPEPTGPDALSEAMRRLAEGRSYLVYWLAVEIARLKLKVRRVLIWTVIGIAALIVALSVLFCATALLLWGLADLIGSALGDRTWAGALIVGGGILALGAGGMYVAVLIWNRSSYRAAKKRFQAMKRKQQMQFGHDVESRDNPPCRS